MIDLHTHTNYSDGTDSVKELLLNAERKGLEVISITDHDSIKAYYELEENSELRKLYRGKIIVGAELTTYYKETNIEVLAYGIDYKKVRIHNIDKIENEIKSLNYFKKVIDKLGFKYDEKELYIDKNNPKKQWSSYVLTNELLKYPENEILIKKVGDFNNTSFFRKHKSNKNSIFYIDDRKNLIDLNETISRIHEAGGLAFLAHGFVYPFEDKKFTLEEILKTTDIDGLECEYPLFSEKERKYAKELCKKYNKFMCGGSDYHSKTKPNIELGNGINNNLNIHSSLINDWIDKVKII